MRREQKAESELLGVYGGMMTLVPVLVIMAIIGFKYFAGLPQLASRNLEQEHTRLLNVLAMVRSQWLLLGKPRALPLNWQTTADQPTQAPGRVRMSGQGWPLPDSLDEAGCRALWQQLMGKDPAADALTASYRASDDTCRFALEQGDSLVYRLNSGGVIFLTN
ncbi:MSHA biogenesis protein MshF [Shewanella salipaludis]|uniref:MSHA biogenesis protein MshF n=1 Tax=Shewanella salipaludis TaxID=2723052 RepID=A0A972FT27_9GAMM|nr:MSHA biogenesis protein MshF [Shewanella salipaludis]NMH65216.1 MSHA biogenesis protein MshF [Shewanella salipaludis]